MTYYVSSGTLNLTKPKPKQWCVCVLKCLEKKELKPIIISVIIYYSGSGWYCSNRTAKKVWNFQNRQEVLLVMHCGSFVTVATTFEWPHRWCRARVLSWRCLSNIWMLSRWARNMWSSIGIPRWTNTSTNWRPFCNTHTRLTASETHW